MDTHHYITNGWEQNNANEATGAENQPSQVYPACIEMPWFYP